MSNKANKPLEELFKSALEEHQMPYDPSAWRAMSSKLDAQLPVHGKSKWPWFLGAASAIGIVTVSLLYSPSPEKTAQTKLSTSKVNEKESITDNKEINKTYKSESHIQIEELKPILPEVIHCGIQAYIETTAIVEKNEPVVDPKVSTEKGEQIGVIETTSSPTIRGNQTDEWLELSVPSLCLGESHTINNKNSVDILIRDAYSNEIVVPASSSYSYTARHEGKHEVLTANSKVSKESFTVKSAPQLALHLDNDLIYEKGLPTTMLSVNSTGSSVEWYLNNKLLSTESPQLKIHLFTKGSYTFKASSMNEFGCKTDVLRTLLIDDEYNLLAVNAFDPQSADNRKNAFMPYALTVREVDFELIIIDPKDGAVVFESNDATLPWRGQDKRNGQLVEPSKTFIWRVILSNPQPGEKSEYKGTIVRL
jgi:hypothetical protein